MSFTIYLKIFKNFTNNLFVCWLVSFWEFFFFSFFLSFFLGLFVFATVKLMWNYDIFNSIDLIDKESGEGRQPRRSRKRDLLKRVMSSSHHRSNTIEASDSERFDLPVRDAKSIVSEFPPNEIKQASTFFTWFTWTIWWQSQQHRYCFFFSFSAQHSMK